MQGVVPAVQAPRVLRADEGRQVGFEAFELLAIDQIAALHDVEVGSIELGLQRLIQTRWADKGTVVFVVIIVCFV